MCCLANCGPIVVFHYGGALALSAFASVVLFLALIFCLPIAAFPLRIPLCLVASARSFRFRWSSLRQTSV